MDNAEIAHQLLLLSKLMEIHGENAFKAKSYAAAAFAIDKLPVQVSTLPAEKVLALKGVGEAIGKKIGVMLQGGRLQPLDDLVIKTPLGILEMLKIKGLGPKKIQTIWKELEIETIGELLYACNENRLTLYKGFGEKTQANIGQAIEFYLGNQGSYLWAQVEQTAGEITQKLRGQFVNHHFELTGDFRRQATVIHKLEWVTDVPFDDLKQYFEALEYNAQIADGILTAKGHENLSLVFYPAATELLWLKQFETTASTQFLEAWNSMVQQQEAATCTSEEAWFAKNGLQPIPPCLRETAAIIQTARTGLPQIIQPTDIKGIIHTHSHWSDGSHSIEEMARGAIAARYEYLVISDHSKSAFYAKGLYPDRIKAQHELIDELNQRLKPFKIFKSIESDILNDGNLDYENEVLASFDLVIASVHSNLKMPQEKAMKRLLTAISHPFTTIIGHLTGRLLLSRNGYPVDYDQIIAACAQHQVVIEHNAHPRRLDMDWSQIAAAVDKGVLISINPDAHAVEAFDHVRYGVLSAQKAGLTPRNNLSSFNLQELEAFLEKQRQKRQGNG